MSISRVLDSIRRQSPTATLVYAVVLVFSIGMIDYATGYEVSFFPFYSIPILLMLAVGDTRAAMAVCILSALTWCAADLASGHPYAREWLRLWDTIVRLIFFGLIVMAGVGLRRHRDANRLRIELLERTQALEDEIIQISERAQQRIGRDLHDGFCQYLASVGFAAVGLRDGLMKEGSPRAQAAADLAHAVSQAVVRAREVARGLSPVDQDRGGLESALDELATNTRDLSGISCGFIGDAAEIEIANEAATNLFRIAQEALNNAIRHSQPSRVTIALERSDGMLSLRISDNGRGFEETGKRGRGMGLNIMRYRAHKIGATLDFTRNNPSGTVVTCTVPLTKTQDPSEDQSAFRHGQTEIPSGNH